MNDDPRPLRPDEDAFLDRMLDAAPKVEPSAALRRAVAEIPLRHPHPATSAATSHGLFTGWLLRWALVPFALSIVAGVWAGLEQDVWPEVTFASAAEAEAQAIEDASLEELSLLAYAGDLDAELEP